MVLCGWAVVPPAMVLCGWTVVPGGTVDCAPVRQEARCEHDAARVNWGMFNTLHRAVVVWCWDDGLPREGRLRSTVPFETQCGDD